MLGNTVSHRQALERFQGERKGSTTAAILREGPKPVS
jgi:hypothetical protein